MSRETEQLTALVGAIAALKRSRSAAQSASELLKNAGQSVSSAEVREVVETLYNELASLEIVRRDWMGK